MNIVIKESPNSADTQRMVTELYEAYASKLLAYTKKHYSINEDDAMSLVYKTIYRMVEVYDRYSFENEHKRAGFVFKTHINYLRNYYRDNTSFESRHLEVDLTGFDPANDEPATATAGFALKLLQQHLDKLEDWQRILLLMRGQDMPYSEISKFVNRPEKQLKVYYGRLKKQLLVDMNEELQRLNALKDGKK